MILFKCPNCSEPMEAPASMQGEHLDCPKCKQPSLVPPSEKIRIIQGLGKTPTKHTNTRAILICFMFLGVLLTIGALVQNSNREVSYAQYDLATPESLLTDRDARRLIDRAWSEYVSPALGICFTVLAVFIYCLVVIIDALSELKYEIKLLRRSHGSNSET